ncbi:MAG: alpha/beta hydrolase [Actinomycetota bacterium]|nr:alpha/beta hydrolase [Actinomycetota bacterium]
MRIKPRVALVAALTAGLMLPGAAAATAMTHPSRSAAHRTAGATHTTSALEARRSAAVETPILDWWDCETDADCATVDVPLDYDEPQGGKTQIALARVHATDTKNKIGTLFVNPGGPGGSGIEMALQADFFLSETLLKRFDVVGFDPRGIGYSGRLECFDSEKDRQRATAGIVSGAFPVTSAEEKEAMASAKAMGKACSTRDKALATSMSTAQAARDMDLLRRAVGDDKLTYLGFSYGSELGLTYANMYPDRVRAVTVDGVIDPVAWAGTSKTASTVLDERLRSHEGAYKALKEILTRCGAATTAQCPLAGTDVVATFDALAERLKKEPATFTTEDGATATITYASLIMDVLSDLYRGVGPTKIMWEILWLEEITDHDTPAATRARAQKSFLALRKERKLDLLNRVQDATDAHRLRGFPTRSAPGRAFPYDNSLETYSGVTCSDGLHPQDVSVWPRATAAMDQRAPYFGRAWGWTTVQCASNTWTAEDEDVYRGPFNRRTASPVLLVGNYWDPATAYTAAQSAAARMPNARLISSDSWGHTAYGSSLCLTSAVDTYLLKQTVPAAGTTCTSDLQPFTEDFDDGSPGDSSDEAGSSSAAGENKILPPIAADPVLQQAIENLQETVN